MLSEVCHIVRSDVLMPYVRDVQPFALQGQIRKIGFRCGPNYNFSLTIH